MIKKSYTYLIHLDHHVELNLINQTFGDLCREIYNT
jgi:hypothetical protein